MDVLAHGPATWFLLGDGDRRYFDVRVSRSAAEWSQLIELDDVERAAYAARGTAFLDELAARIDGEPEAYAARDLRATLGKQVTATIVAWRAGAARAPHDDAR